MEMIHPKASVGQFGSAAKCTAAVGNGNERHVLEGSLHQQIYLTENHGSDDDIMEVRKREEDIKLVHTLSWC